MRKWWGSSQKASIYIYVSALCLCFLNCDCYQLSFPWPSISSQQVPQCRTGTRKPYKRSCVLLCFQHATFTMAWKIFLVETGDGRNLSSWSALSRELFHCTSLLNNNNKNPLLSQCFCSNPGLLPPSHSHREMLSWTVFIVCVLAFCLYHRDWGLLVDSITQRQTWAEIQDHRLNWHFLGLHVYK